MEVSGEAILGSSVMLVKGGRPAAWEWGISCPIRTGNSMEAWREVVTVEGGGHVSLGKDVLGLKVVQLPIR